MTTITAPVKMITLQARVPDVVRSCIVQQPSPPPDPGEEPPSPVTGPGIYTPVAPGVIYDNLPVVSIVDTSPDQMIGCIIDTADNPQGRLNALFPSAVDGDGVIERSTNDIWVFGGTTWENVGPTPGPTIVTATVIPPWNEIVAYNAIVRSRVEVTSLPYALALLSEPDAYGVSIGVTVNRVVPRAAITLAASAPTISTGASVDAPLASVATAAQSPSVSTGASVAVPAVGIALLGFAPESAGPSSLLINVPVQTLSLASGDPSISTGYSAIVPPTNIGITVQVPGINEISYRYWQFDQITANVGTVMEIGEFVLVNSGSYVSGGSWSRSDDNWATSTAVGSAPTDGVLTSRAFQLATATWPNRSIRYDHGSTVTATGLKYANYFRPASRYITGLRISGSSDGTSYTEITTLSGMTAYTAGDTTSWNELSPEYSF